MNFERRRDQPFEQGPASKILTQIPFREPPGFQCFPYNLGDDLMWKRKFRGAHNSRPGRQRPSRRVPLVELTGIELLDRRILPAVTASFAADGTLRVVGDDQDNTIVVSRDAAGTILVNNGAVAIQGGPATVANTHVIFLNGGDGNDNLSLNETNGALPVAKLDGGDGNDVLTGGSGVTSSSVQQATTRSSAAPATTR